MREEHIERRQFLRQTAAGATWAVASAATAAEIPNSQPATLRDGRATVETEADVLVVGSGVQMALRALAERPRTRHPVCPGQAVP